jgi:exopolyphosphatase/guanosine-5'-triphosphate,3'-diphosphate pyrophosphatase
VVGGGLCILYTLLVQFGIDELLPTKGALRQGVIFDLAARLHADQGGSARDVRDQSITELQRRFGVDVPQAKRVQQLALAFYKQLQPRAPRELQRELGWAAAVHELGMTVSHHDHHRHTAYLLSHVDAPGFSQNQLRRLGDLALGQRGGLRKLDVQLQDESLLFQLISLRLAVIKCHARIDTAFGAIRLTRRGRELQLHLNRGWSTAHPRALYLLQEEAQAWSRTDLLSLALINPT